jgi:hypothetical protein
MAGFSLRKGKKGKDHAQGEKHDTANQTSGEAVMSSKINEERIQVQTRFFSKFYSNDIEVKIAHTDDALLLSKRIRYQSYLNADFIEKNDERCLSDAFDGVPQTITFLGAFKGKTIATMRLVLDTKSHGLPMDKEGFTRDLSILRNRGRRLAETCKLAVIPEYQSQTTKGVIFALQRKMLWHAIDSGVTDLVIAIANKSVNFYRNVLLFEPIGEARSYGSLKVDRAFAYRLDLTTLKKRYFERYAGRPFDLHHFFFGPVAA